MSSNRFQRMPRMRGRAVPVRAGFAVAGLLLAGGAQAVVYCVSNSQQLQNALDKSGDGGVNNGLDNHIHLVQGIYSVALKETDGTFTYINTGATGDLGIQGGYTAGCDSRSPDPYTTRVDGFSEFPVFDLASVHGTITVSDLTVQNGRSLGSNSGGGLVVNDELRDRAAAVIENVVIRDNHSDASGGGFSVGADGSGNQAVMHGCVVTHNSAGFDAGGGEILGNGPGVLFYDNTVYANTVSDSQGTAGIYAYGSSCEFANNILYNNGDVDLKLACSDASLYYNDIGSVDGGGDEVGELSVAPRFVDAAGQDFHLASNSHLLGASHVFFPVRDNDGYTYPTHGAQDIGAYEDTVFTDGFDVAVLTLR